MMSKSSKVSVYRSLCNNPFVNLSIENYLLTKHANEENHNILFLWRNSPSVIIGRFQSAWKECRVEKMKEDGIFLVRRSSGGGAVFQDLGNSIFSFICDKKYHHGNNDAFYSRNNEIVIRSLSRIGISGVEATGRNDLQLDGKKISGAAFKHTKTARLHHGTLLLDVNMGELSKYLTPNRAKLQSKGVSSVASRVMNLKEAKSDINHDMISKSLIEEFFTTYNNRCEVVDVDEGMLEVPEIRQFSDTLQNFDWVLGKDPHFSHSLETRFPWGTIEIRLDVHNSVIGDVAIFSDCLDVLFIDMLKISLEKRNYSQNGIAEAQHHLNNEINNLFQRNQVENGKQYAETTKEIQMKQSKECMEWISQQIRETL